MEVRVVREALELWEGDCVARVVRSDGESITAVARRLETAAGPNVSSRLQAMGELPLGSAVITPGGELPARFLLHLVLQSDDESVSPEIVRRATGNALARAADLGLDEVALPPLGTHAGVLDAEPVARSMAEGIRRHGARDGDGGPRRVVVVVASEYEHEIYRRILVEGREE